MASALVSALWLLVPLVAGPAPSPAVPGARHAAADTLVWRIDRTHSELSFRVRYLVSRVPGTFLEWKGEMVADPRDWSTGRVTVEIDAASISTRHERRDSHLRSADFLDVATYPTITFRSTRVAVAGDAIRLTGDLTIRGVTREVVLEGEVLGTAPERNGGLRAGFTVSTAIDRLDYGIAWNRAAEGGGLVLGDEVRIDITVAAVTSGPTPTPSGS